MQTNGVNKRFAHCMDMLAKSPLFAGVSRENLPRVLVLMRARCHSFAKGEVLQGFGEPFRYVGILMSGEVEGSFDSERFDRINVNRFTAGQMYGAAFACARVPESPIELVALRSTEVVLLDVGVLGTGGQPDALEAVLLRNLLGIVSTQSVFLNRKVRILGQHSLRDRIVVYLGGLAAEECRLPRDGTYGGRGRARAGRQPDEACGSAAATAATDASIVGQDEAAIKCLAWKPSVHDAAKL